SSARSRAPSGERGSELAGRGDRNGWLGAVGRKRAVRGVHVREVGEDVVERQLGGLSVVDGGEEVVPHRLVAGGVAKFGPDEGSTGGRVQPAVDAARVEVQRAVLEQ